MKPRYNEKKVNEAVLEYLHNYEPSTASAAINRLLIHAVEKEECFLCAEKLDALKGLNKLLLHLGRETHQRYAISES